MSWLDASWAKRWPVAVDNTGGSAGNVDATWTIPTEWDDFWTGVLSSGADMRVTYSDGRTLVTWKRTTWDYAARSGVIDLSQVAVGADAIEGFWLYWKNPDGTNVATSPSISTPKAVNAYVGRPTSPLVSLTALVPGETAPRATIAKSDLEETRVWWDFGPLLARASGTLAGHRVLEEIKRVTLVDCTTGGVSQAAMLSVGGTFLLSGMVGTVVKGGTSGTDYTLIVRVKTTLNRVLEGRARLRVRSQSGG